MPPSHTRRWPALLLLSLLPFLALLQSCSDSFAVVTRTPTISPAGGEFSAPVTVTLTDITPSAAIFYTLDGTTPTSSSTHYTAPFNLAQSATVQAIATAPQAIPSFIARATFTVAISPVAAAPTFAPPAGTYTTAQSVTLSDATPNATIYYTTNGTTPTTTSPIYTTPIPVSSSETISAIASAPGYTISPIATAAYIIQIPQTAAPTFAPPAGTYTAAQSVTLADATPNATIYYTTNGTTPTTSSTPYTTPLPVSASETISAIAIAPGYTLSPIATAAYTIQIPASTCANPGPGIICTIAGNGTGVSSGDGGPATSAGMASPWGVALDASGNLYIGDANGLRIRKVTPAGIISTVAGNGSPGYGGDGGPATSASVATPDELALDSVGNLYIADEYCPCIRMVNTAGIISTFAGNHTAGSTGDGGPATSAQLNGPIGVKFDAVGNLYIADRFADNIRKVTPAGIISTVAGNGTSSSTGDGGPATSAGLSQPYDVAFDATGNMYISEGSGARVRKVTPAGIISTFAGDGASGYAGDGGPATSAELNDPHGLNFDAAGNLYIGDINNQRVRKITPAGIISTFAGNGLGGFSGDGGPATSAGLTYPEDIVFDPSGNMYIADWGNHRVRKVFSSTTAAPNFTPPAGAYATTQTVTIASTTPNATIYYTTNGTTPTTSSNVYTAPLTVSTSETIEAIAIAPGYTTSPVATAIYTISPAVSGCSLSAGFSSGTICTVAGDGTYGYSGDGGAAVNAEMSIPQGAALDSSGNLYFADVANHRIRKVTPAGLIFTVAGNGTQGYSGDGGPATNAELSNPYSVSLDGSGNLYIVDGNSRIRVVTPAGLIATVAGNGAQGYSGDGGPATSAELYDPNSVAVDGSGNLYIADTGNSRIRVVTPAGLISTFAGNGINGYSGDGGLATAAQISDPFGVAVDSSGNLYIADTNNSRIRKVTPAGLISTFVGNGVYGYSGDGGSATAAELATPSSLATDSSGNLYIADIGSDRIRKVTAAGIISTLAGTAIRGYNGDGILATAAELYDPFGLAIDSTGNLFIADGHNNRIRKVIH
jgi:sugar lactone lactonase YvrE